MLLHYLGKLGRYHQYPAGTRSLCATSNTVHDGQHLLFQQHVPVMTTIDFYAWLNEKQWRTAEL